MPFPGMADGLGPQLLQRRQLYAVPMSKLRLLMICRMAKPEEVLIVEDENGNIVRETMKDNDVLVQYKVFNLCLADVLSLQPKILKVFNHKLFFVCAHILEVMLGILFAFAFCFSASVSAPVTYCIELLCGRA